MKKKKYKVFKEILVIYFSINYIKQYNFAFAFVKFLVSLLQFWVCTILIN